MHVYPRPHMTPATPLFFDRVAYEAMVSYESLVAEFSIPQSKLEEECRENVWRKVSSKFTKWRNAAPHFELDEDVVEAAQSTDFVWAKLYGYTSSACLYIIL